MSIVHALLITVISMMSLIGDYYPDPEKHCSFLKPTMVGGELPFRLKFALKVTHPL